MLGVDGIVLDGGVEPQAVALLAVVERALERPGGLLAAAAAGARPGALRLRRLLVLGGLLLGGLAGGLLGGLGLLLGAADLLGLELRGDRGVVLGAEVDLVGDRAVGGGLAVGLQAVLALEGLDLLDGHLELVGDPGVGATLSHPPTDLVKLRTQRPAAHEQAGRLAKTPRVLAPWCAGRHDGRLREAQFGAISPGYPGTTMRYRMAGRRKCSY